MVSRGVCTILNGIIDTNIASGTPCGKQCNCGLSCPKVARRCLYSAVADGSMGTSTPSPAMLSTKLLSAACQIPERSGLPSDALGAGAIRLGLPSGVRGVPGSGRLSHCARATPAIPNSMVIATIKATIKVCKRFAARVGKVISDASNSNALALKLRGETNSAIVTSRFPVTYPEPFFKAIGRSAAVHFLPGLPCESRLGVLHDLETKILDHWIREYLARNA